MARKRSRRRSGKKGKGLGQLKLKGMARDVVPPVVGSVLTMGTALGIRAYLRPEPGTTSALVYRWAPAIGVGAGVLGAAAMYMVGGSGPASSAALTSIIQGGVLIAMEKLNAATPGALATLMGEPAALPAGTEGLRAIVPEYGTRGFGAIVTEQLNGGLGANLQHQGAEVNLSGVVNTGAFGSSPFN
jgi:hypothetical protein